MLGIFPTQTIQYLSMVYPDTNIEYTHRSVVERRMVECTIATFYKGFCACYNASGSTILPL